MKITRSAILAVIRRAPTLADLANSDDERLEFEAGLLPRSYLYKHFSLHSETDRQWLNEQIDELAESRRVIQSPKYVRANPKDRTRPIATNYDVERPTNPPARSRILITVAKRDLLALWYAAANHDLSGSQGNTTALHDLLKFWRLPRIQKAWRVWIGFQRSGHYKGKLPKDAL